MAQEAFSEFLRRQVLGVVSTLSANGGPQAAVVGVVVTEEGEVFFDTLATSRKCQNLRRDPRAAVVLGWDLAEGRTVQLEGIADEPRGEELERFKQAYFARFPDGREREQWPDITYFRVRPGWIRDSDFRSGEPSITEFEPGVRAPPAGSMAVVSSTAWRRS